MRYTKRNEIYRLRSEDGGMLVISQIYDIIKVKYDIIYNKIYLFSSSLHMISTMNRDSPYLFYILHFLIFPSSLFNNKSIILISASVLILIIHSILLLNYVVWNLNFINNIYYMQFFNYFYQRIVYFILIMNFIFKKIVQL